MDAGISRKYSHAEDYASVAKAAIAEMVRQQPKAFFYPEKGIENGKEGKYITEAEDGYLIAKGVIVRQLLLPGLLLDAKKIIRYLVDTYGDQIYLSLMSQYTPLKQVENYPELNRKVTDREYEKYLDYAISLGVTHGFIQEGDVAKDSFIPAFDCEGV